jgi:hypothetical protein
MKRYFAIWSLAAAAALVLAAAEPALAQRAQPRGRTSGDSGDRGDSGGGSGRAVPRGGSDSAPAPAPAPRPSGGTSRPAASDGGDSSQPRTAPPYSRPRGDQNPTGTAVRRPAGNPPPSGGGTVIIPGYGGYYPWGWGYGGFGYGGYYGFYDPWWYDGGYYGGYYAQPYYSRGYYDGSLRLKIKPRDASVFVDGYYAGRVDEFDGIFQQLHIEPGPHRIEVRADGYEPLTFEVRILPDRKVTYEGELKAAP